MESRITTVAGSGRRGFSGDGGPGRQAALNRPYSVAAGPGGFLYIADYFNHCVRMLSPEGLISTVAGRPEEAGCGGDGGPALAAQLWDPAYVAVSGDNAIYIADWENNRVRMVTASGTIHTVVGGASHEAELNGPSGVAIGTSGDLYIADQGSSRILRIDRDGIIGTFAGTGESGFSGDGGAARAARLSNPVAVTVDAEEFVYIADQGNGRIRRVSPDGVISTYAGAGQAGFEADDGRPAVESRLDGIVDVVAAVDGSVYISEYHGHRVRRIRRDGTIQTIVGTGIRGFGGDGGPAHRAQIANPRGLAFGVDGSLYVADTMNDRVRRVDLLT